MSELVYDTGNLKIPYIVKRNKVKHVYIKVRQNGVEVTVPRKKNIVIKDLLEEKKEWIEKKYRELMSIRFTISKDKVLFKGREYDLRYEKGYESIQVENDSVKIIAPNRRRFYNTLRQWMAKESKRIIEDVIAIYAPKLGVSYNRLFLRNSNSWGTCSIKKNLGFNWQLASLPEELVEYVVIHELVHLKELNHSKRFWNIVTSLCPNYRQRRNELKLYRTKKTIR